VVYIYGGYYADLDVVLHQRFFSFIPADADAVFTKERNNIVN
jgi:mannosyltransferase OCH1-like enzyme